MSTYSALMKQLQLRQMNSLNQTEEEESDEDDGQALFNGVVYHCDICNVPCFGENAWYEHQRGRKHKNKILNKSQKQQDPTKHSFKCITCNTKISGLAQWRDHIHGKPHQKQVATLAIQRQAKNIERGIPLIGTSNASKLSAWQDDFAPFAKNILIQSLTTQWNEFNWNDIEVTEDLKNNLSAFTAKVPLPTKPKYVAVGTGSTKQEAKNNAAIDACKHLSSFKLLLVPEGLYVKSDIIIEEELDEIPSTLYGLIIGTGGENLKKIMERTCTYIKIPSKEDKYGLITIAGDPESVQKAKQELLGYLKKGSKDHKT